MGSENPIVSDDMEEPKETTVASKYVLTGRLFEKKSLSGIEKALTTLSEEQLTMPLSSNSILEGSWEPSGTIAANGEEGMTGHQAVRFTGELPKCNHDDGNVCECYASGETNQ